MNDFIKQILNGFSLSGIALILGIGAIPACTSAKSGGNSAETASAGTAQRSDIRSAENKQEISKETPKEAPKQTKSLNKNLPDCRIYKVVDADRLSFDSGKQIKTDVDGDGELDTITPRNYKAEGRDEADPQVNELHWIAFDLKTSGGGEAKSFFKYNYGNNVVDYYVYALVACKSNGDEKADLLFYIGDDDSEETVILESMGISFKEISRKQTSLDGQ